MLCARDGVPMPTVHQALPSPCQVVPARDRTNGSVGLRRRLASPPAGGQTLNDSPHPHERFTSGFLKRKPWFMRFVS